MKKVTITIETENAAFEEFPALEVGRILRRVCQRIEKYNDLFDFPVRDINGNTVGRVSVD